MRLAMSPMQRNQSNQTTDGTNLQTEVPPYTADPDNHVLSSARGQHVLISCERQAIMCGSVLHQTYFEQINGRSSYGIIVCGPLNWRPQHQLQIVFSNRSRLLQLRLG